MNKCECKCAGIEEKYDFPDGKDYLILCRGCRVWLDIAVPPHIPSQQWAKFVRKISRSLNDGSDAEVIDPELLS